MLPSPPPRQQARKTRIDLTAVLIRRRKAAVALLLALSIGVAALALISFMRLMPVRGDAAHSVDALERVRVLENALSRAYEAAINRDRTPREAQALWSDVARYAKPVSEIEPDDDEEARAVKGFNDDASEALKSIAEGVSLLERSDPLLAASARQNARIGIDRLRDAARSVGDTAARQLDQQMGAARLWLAICIGLVFLTGLMMAVTVLTWVYANHADRVRARRLNPGVPAGEAYAEAALRLSLMIDRGPLAVVEWNSDYTCTRWSGRAEEMFGRPAADVVGKRWDDLKPYIHPDDEQRVASELAPLMRGDTDYVVIRHRNVRPDGTVIHCIWYNSALRDGDGPARFGGWGGGAAPRTFLSLATDVTRQVEAEESFHQEARLVRRIADTAPFGITVSNAAGAVLFANDFIIELLGASREDMVGGRVTIADWTLEELDGTPIADHDRPSAVAMRTGQVVRAREVRVRSRFKPEPTSLAITAVPLRDGPGSIDGVLLIHEDIAERMAAEGEREALAAELGQARRLETVGNLASGIAHDFGNALLAISYSADLLSAAASAGRPTREPAAQLTHAIDVARELTASLVNYAAGRDATRRPLDFGAFLAASCKFVGRLLPINFKITCSPLPATPVAINASAPQLLQVLMNLAINARDAMPDGGAITMALSTDTTPPTPSAVLEITDTGQGMSPEVSKRAFDRFFTTKDSGRGTGIGLSTVRHIVQEHGGTIEVATAPGQGSRFTIRLPLIRADLLPPAPQPATAPAPAAVQAAALSDAAHAAMTAAARPAAASPGLGLPRAMVVESDDRVRPLIVQTLRNSGYNVEAFTSTTAALDAFAAAPDAWAVVLLELGTGGLDGATALRRMRKAAPRLPAVLLTSDAADAGGQLADDHTRVLLKPFTVGSLRSTLKDLFSHPTPR